MKRLNLDGVETDKHLGNMTVNVPFTYHFFSLGSSVNAKHDM